MVRIGLLVVVIAALGGVTGWFFSHPPAAPSSSNVMNQAHAPTHGPKPEEAAAVDEEEAVVKEELPVLEHGVSPSLKHLLLFAADGCAKRVHFWTAKEQLFAADLRLAKGPDGVTASVLRDVTNRPPFERCLDRELRTQHVNDIELTAPEMRTYFSLAEVTDLEKRSGELPETPELLALVKRCAPHADVMIRYDALVNGAAVVLKPEFQGETELEPSERSCLQSGLERTIAFTDENRPGWKGVHLELKVDAAGKASKSSMKFLK